MCSETGGRAPRACCCFGQVCSGTERFSWLRLLGVLLAMGGGVLTAFQDSGGGGGGGASGGFAGSASGSSAGAAAARGTN